MAKIAIVTDSTSDIPQELMVKWNLHVANAFVHFGTETYMVNDMGLEEFYERMENMSDEDFPKTSQPKASEFLEIYEKIKADGIKQILSIHVAHKLSGTINSANVAKGMIDGIDIRIIDSQGATANLFAVVKKAHELVSQGKDIDTVESETIEFAKSLISYMTLKTLDNLVRGGRISKIRYRFGRFLNIKPILRLKEGELGPYTKARGLERARNKMFDEAMKLIEGQENINYIIGHTLEEEASKEIEENLLAKYPNADGYIIDIGIVIAAHGGRGAILLLVY